MSLTLSQQVDQMSAHTPMWIEFCQRARTRKDYEEAFAMFESQIDSFQQKFTELRSQLLSMPLEAFDAATLKVLQIEIRICQNRLILIQGEYKTLIDKYIKSKTPARPGF